MLPFRADRVALEGTDADVGPYLRGGRSTFIATRMIGSGTRCRHDSAALPAAGLPQLIEHHLQLPRRARMRRPCTSTAAL